MQKIRKYIYSGITALGVLSLAFLEYRPSVKERQIEPIAFEDINGDGKLDAIIITGQGREYKKGLQHYLDYNSKLYRDGAKDCMMLNPLDHLHPQLILGYVNGNDITLKDNEYFTKAQPKVIGNIDDMGFPKKSISFKLSEKGDRLYVGRPGLISYFDIRQFKQQPARTSSKQEQKPIQEQEKQ